MKTLWFCVVLGLLPACGADTGGVTSGGEVCTPGKQETCACPGGASGAQACKDDGSGFEKCQCSTSSSSSGGGGAGTTGSGGAASGGSGGGGGTCVPGTQATVCAPFGYECGLVDDGCGGEINCGFYTNHPDYCGDPDDPFTFSEYYACGLGDPIVNSSGRTNGVTETGTPNFCGGGCAQMTLPNDTAHGCAGSPFPHAWFCSKGVNNPPKDQTCMASGSTPTQVWCCQ